MTDKVSVLVVEDDPLLRDVYELILSTKGFDVATADNGIDAFEKLKLREPDVMLLDYFMPLMDGATFLKNFDSSLYPHVRIVVTSNISDKEVLENMVFLGAHSVALKAALSPAELVALVHKVAEMSE